MQKRDKIRIESDKIQYIKENIKSKPIECAEILSTIDSEILSIVDLTYYYKHLGFDAFNNGDYFKAHTNWQKSLQLAIDNNIFNLIDALHLDLSAIYYYTQQYKKAIHHCFIASRSKTKRIQTLAFQNLALNYEYTDDFERAMHYNKKAIAISEKLNKPIESCAALANSGNILRKQGNNKEALRYYEKAVAIVEQSGKESILSDVYMHLARFYKETSDFSNADKYAIKSKEFADKYEIKRNYPQLYAILINGAYQKKEVLEAQSLLTEFKNLGLRDGDEFSMIEIFNLQIEIEYECNGAESALKASKEKSEFISNREERSVEQFKLFRQFKEAENEKIEDAFNKLDHSNKQLLNVTKILAHDIKTPVRTLASFSNLLKKELADIPNSNAHEYLDFISSASSTLYTKLDYALNLILMELKKPLEDVDLNSCALNTVGNFQQLELNIPNSLPTIKSNKELMSSLFQHIFSNATYYNDIEVKQLSVSFKEDKETLNLIFKDNGNGISPDHLHKVFDIFYTSQPEAKNGMGLTLSRKICELHGGEISIKSELNKGTEVLVKLPRG